MMSDLKIILMGTDAVIFFTVIGICVLVILVIFVLLIRTFNKQMRKSQVYVNLLKEKRNQELQEERKQQEEQKKIVLSMSED